MNHVRTGSLYSYPKVKPSGMAKWPENWPKHYNGSCNPCDMIVGPCSCGAWHQYKEFFLVNGKLVRQ